MAPGSIDRRDFVRSLLVIAAAGKVGAQASDVPDWGVPVIDVHLHLRGDLDGNFRHISGCGVSQAVLLTNVSAEDRAREVVAKYPGRFVRFASSDMASPITPSLSNKTRPYAVVTKASGPLR